MYVCVCVCLCGCYSFFGLMNYSVLTVPTRKVGGDYLGRSVDCWTLRYGLDGTWVDKGDGTANSQ